MTEDEADDAGGDDDAAAEELQRQRALEEEERARKEAEKRMADLDEERAREAAKRAQEAAAAAAANRQPPPANLPPVAPAVPGSRPGDETIKTFIKEQHALKKEVEAAAGKFEDARRKGTPEEITEAGKVLKAARTKKRQHYNLAISKCVWPEVYFTYILNYA